MTFEQHTQCPVCAGAHLVPIKGYEDTNLYRCSDCTMVFSRNIANEEMLKNFYSNEYKRTTYFSPITVSRYEHLLDTLEPYRKTNRILDVGAGCGFLLEVARKKGWEVYGTEYTEDVIRQCKDKGIDMRMGSLQDVGFEPETFDVIVCIEVIEHLVDPKKTVEEMYRLLRPGGCVYLTTPNFNALLRYRLKSKYNIISFPLHLTYFTPRTIRQLFTDKGFSPLSIKTTGYSRTRLRTSQGKSNQDFVSETSDDEMLRYKIEHNGFLRLMKHLTNGILNLFKVGDSLKATFTKK